MAGRPFKPIDLTGQVSGYLTAIKIVGRVAGKSGSKVWECRCVCGTLTKVSSGNFKHGHYYSCGCMKKLLIGAKKTTHGHTRNARSTRTYVTWQAMLSRCEYERDKEYFRYGAKGIKVCDRWHTFENFLADMGIRPAGRTIDRIDGSKGYEPPNCRWATATEQVHNTDRYRRVHGLI